MPKSLRCFSKLYNEHSHVSFVPLIKLCSVIGHPILIKINMSRDILSYIPELMNLLQLILCTINSVSSDKVYVFLFFFYSFLHLTSE